MARDADNLDQYEFPNYMTSFDGSFFQPHIHTIKFLARIGYGISLASLVCALLILVSIK